MNDQAKELAEYFGKTDTNNNILLCLTDEEMFQVKEDLEMTMKWLGHDEWEVRRDLTRHQQYVAEGIWSEASGNAELEQDRKRLSKIRKHKNNLEYIINKLHK